MVDCTAANMGDLIDEIIKREGGSVATNDPNDKGGRTQYGISERSNPEAWKDGRVDYNEARAIYEAKYLVGPGFDKIKDSKLRSIMVDFGVTSGPQLAILRLQETLKVKVDGVLGPKTLAALELEEPRRLANKIALERIKMASRIVKKDPSQLKWLGGWIERFSEFID